MQAESTSTKPKQPYRTTNWHEYDAALMARGSLRIWLDKDMQWFTEPGGSNGRPQTYTDAAIQFCLSIKCLFNLAGRQTQGMVQSLLLKHRVARCAMRPSRPASGLVGGSGKSGLAIIGAVWWKPKCIASSVWGNG
jgi:hypothetical protein